MNDEITGDQIQAYLTNKLSILKYAERDARRADEAALEEARKRDLAEWESLDEASRKYLVDFLRTTPPTVHEPATRLKK